MPAPPAPADSTPDATLPGRKRGSNVIRLVGSLLAVASVAFVAQRLFQYLDGLQAHLSSWAWGWMPVAVLVFTLSQLLLSYAWYLLLRWQGTSALTAASAHVLCGLAQLSKYIPGNVFQYVARHLAFRRLGVKDDALVLAAAYETLGFVAAAGLVSVLGLPFYGEESTFISPPLAVAASVIAVAALWVLVRYGQPLLKLVGRAPKDGTPMRIRQVLRVVPLYAAFLAFSGLLALLIFRGVGGASSRQLAVIPAYSLAWLCGYVVPGASGGLGIREATLLVLLGDTPQGVLVAVGMRLITLLGDVLWFAGSTLASQLGQVKPG